MYALYLSMLGYRVETAVDGHEAVVMTCKLHLAHEISTRLANGPARGVQGTLSEA